MHVTSGRGALLLVAGLLAVVAVACGSSGATSSAITATAPPTELVTLIPEPSSSTTLAPTTTAVSRSSLASLSGRTIVIDPGHAGGNAAHSADIAQQVFIGTGWKECDTSGTATYGGYAEHAHNWDVALRLVVALRAAGANVVLTRPDDTGWGPCITDRARIGNEARADAVVSIHADGGPDDGRGFHVLYPAAVTPQSAAIAGDSRDLAVALRDAFARITGVPPSTYLGSGGLMARGDLGGLNLSTVPKVFLEAGNMRNAVDATLLGDPAFRQLEAEAIATGLAAWFAGR